MIITNLTVSCKCGRDISVDINSPEAKEPPITCTHECFCGEEFSICVDNTGDELIATVEPIIKVIIDIDEIPDLYSPVD